MKADNWAIKLAAREAGRARRAGWKAAGLCVNCGKARDVDGHRRCRRCITAMLRCKHRHGQSTQARPPLVPWVAPAAKVVARPRWHLPLKGQIAMELFYGLRRKVA